METITLVITAVALVLAGSGLTFVLGTLLSSPVIGRG